MFGIENFLLFLGAGILLNVTPGPDMFYVATRSMCQGRGTGVLSALAITCGGFVHTAAAALGLSAVLMVSATAYDVVRYAGAAYLIYIGLRMLLSKPAEFDGGKVSCPPKSQVFRQGLLVSILNPKVALFYLSFLPQFVDPASPDFAAQLGILGLCFNTTGCIVMTGIALCASKVGSWANKRPGVARVQHRVTGGVFLTMGLGLGLAGGRG